MRTLILCVICAAAAAAGEAVDEMALAVELGWPDWRGPFHRSGIDGGHELIADPAQAKLVWKSEEPVRHKYHLGYGGCSAWPGGACGHAGPIYWDGNIYLNYCQPKEPWPEGREGQRNGMAQARLVDCDEIVVCMDAATGKTVWRTVFEGQGINYAWGKAGGHFVPVIRYGHIYVPTSGGYARCLDAKTGEERWSVELPAAATVRAMKANVKEKGGLRRACGLNRAMCRNPAVAAGVVAFMGGGGKSCGGGPLVGLDAQTGEKRWEARTGAVYCSPVVWRLSADEEYFINQYSCLDPQTGKELWKAPAKHANGHSTVIGEHEGTWYLMAAGKPKVDLKYIEIGRTKGPFSGNQCFRITPRGAELLWELPEQYGCNATAAIYQGDYYFDTPVPSMEHEVAKWQKIMVRVDLATGEIEAETRSGKRHYASFAIADDRILKVSGGERGHRLLTIDADGVTLGGELWQISHMEGGTSILVDGRFYVRGLDAVYCYDLRK